MDLSTFIAFVALIAAAAALIWQRIGTQEQRKARLEDQDERLKRSRRDASNLTTQLLALCMARVTKYSRLETRIERLLKTDLRSEERHELVEHIARVKERLTAYGKQVEDATESLDVLRKETLSNGKSQAHYDALSSTLLNANSYAEATGSDESQAIEDAIKRCEQRVL